MAKLEALLELEREHPKQTAAAAEAHMKEMDAAVSRGDAAIEELEQLTQQASHS